MEGIKGCHLWEAGHNVSFYMRVDNYMQRSKANGTSVLSRIDEGRVAFCGNDITHIDRFSGENLVFLHLQGVF